MVKGIKFRRGTTSDHSTFTGQEGEITVDTTKDVAIVHDGTTIGGHPLVGENSYQKITNKNIDAITLNVSGIVTASQFIGDGSLLTNVPGSANSGYANTAGIATYASTAGISTVSQGLIGTPNITVGIITATSAIIGSAVTITLGGVRTSGIVTAFSFRPTSGYYQSPNGTNGFYVFDTSGDVSFQGKIVTNYIRSNTNINPTITVSDLDLEFARNITVSGITTSTGGFVGNLTGTATNSGYATTAGIATTAYALAGTPNLNVGVVTASSFFGDGSGLTGIVAAGTGVVVQEDGTPVGTAGTINFGTNLTASFSSGVATITATGGGGSQTLDQTLGLGNSSLLGMSVGIITATNLNVTGFATAGVGSIATLRGTNINYSGIGTFASIIATNLNLSGVGTLTTLRGTSLNYTGISTFASIIATNLNLSGVGTLTTLRGTNLNYTGIGTFLSGPVIIGTATSTGTASQPLQVTGSTYISGSVGIGTTIPRETLDVIGTIGVQASSGAANRFEIAHNTSLNSLDFNFI